MQEHGIHPARHAHMHGKSIHASQRRVSIEGSLPALDIDRSYGDYYSSRPLQGNWQKNECTYKTPRPSPALPAVPMARSSGMGVHHLSRPIDYDSYIIASLQCNLCARLAVSHGALRFSLHRERGGGSRAFAESISIGDIAREVMAGQRGHESKVAKGLWLHNLTSFPVVCCPFLCANSAVVCTGHSDGA